jgi:hypothetical protein
VIRLSRHRAAIEWRTVGASGCSDANHDTEHEHMQDSLMRHPATVTEVPSIAKTERS